MKRLATLFLVSGVLIIALALSLAVSAMNGTALSEASEKPVQSNDGCLFCHLESHGAWTTIVSHLIDEDRALPPEIVENLIPTPTSSACRYCHTQQGAETLTAEQIQDAVSSMQERVQTLKNDLEQVFEDNHANWDLDAQRGDKPANQLAAERVKTLLDVVEVDGGWGFHNPDYTRAILAEAETLMAQLQTDPTAHH